MKNKSAFTIVELLVVVAILGILAAVLIPARAEEMVVNGRAFTRDATFGEVPAVSTLKTVTNSTVKSTSSKPVAIPPGVDIGCWVSSTGRTAADTNYVNYGFNTSPNSNVWSTLPPITATGTATGVTPATNYFVISRTNLVGVQYIRWDTTQTTNAGGIFNASIFYQFLTP